MDWNGRVHIYGDTNTVVCISFKMGSQFLVLKSELRPNSAGDVGHARGPDLKVTLMSPYTIQYWCCYALSLLSWENVAVYTPVIR